MGGEQLLAFLEHLDPVVLVLQMGWARGMKLEGQDGGMGGVEERQDNK